VVLGQLSVDSKTSEISRFAPLLDTMTALNLTDVVITPTPCAELLYGRGRPTPTVSRPAEPGWLTL